MADGMIYLSHMAASYFNTYGYGILSASTIKDRHYNDFAWGMVLLNNRVHTFQADDWLDIEVKLPDATLTENVRRRAPGELETRLMMDVPPLPQTALHGLHGKNFADLVDGASPWLKEALERFCVTCVTDMNGRVQLTSDYQLVTYATSLKVRVNGVKEQNLNRVLPIAEADDLNPSSDSDMSYG